MQDCGVDLDDPAIRKGRTWRWLRVRVEGLLSKPPALVVVDGRVVRVPTTRLALALDPPDLTPGPAHPQGADDES